MSDLLNLSDYEKPYRETLKEMKEKTLKTNYKTAREISNEIALESPFGKRSLLFKPDFVTKNIDFIKLSEFIKANIDSEFDYKAFIGTATRTITETVSFGEEAKFDRMAGVPTKYTTTETYETEIPLAEKTFSGERTLQLIGKLYTEKGKVNIHKDSESDITSGLEFEFDFRRKIVNYKIHFYFVGKKRVYENDNTDNIAFTISSSNYEDFYTFLKLINRKYTDDSFENKIEVAFLDAINQLSKLKDEDSYYAQKYNPLKFKNLDWLYQNIPYFVAEKLDFNETVANVFKLNKWDKASIRNDSTAGITGILQKLDSRSVYVYFYKNPEKLITLLNGFDDDELVKNFCAYLTIITFLYTGQDIEKARKFNVGENTHIETNILYGDEEGKVELTNELQLPTFGFNELNFINLFASDIEINNPGKSSNQFHPLDIIYITNYNSATGEEEKYPTIALYGKFLGDKSEWSDVKDALFAVVDVLSMLISFGVISAGIRGVARLFAIIDIAISTINLALLNPDLRNRLNKTEAGKWFVSHWGIISFCVSMGTISYYLAKGIVKYGEQVKQQLRNEKELSKQIDNLIEESRKIADEISEKALKNATGSGGFFRYEKIISRNMVAQEHNMSCAAACIKQIAKDNGIEISEDLVRKFAGTDDILGTTDIGIISGLESIFENKQIIANTYFRNSEKQIPEILKAISKEGSWIASIHPIGAKKHSIIVDKIIGNKIYIRDPWPVEGIGNSRGIEAVVDLDEFSKVWLRAGANRYSIK